MTNSGVIYRPGHQRKVGHPSFWNTCPVVEMVKWPDGGGYPKGFLQWAYRTLGVTNAAEVLHVCSGSVQVGVRVDIRPEVRPDVAADCLNLPLRENSFRWIMCDPPYGEQWAKTLYGTSCPGIRELVPELIRVLKPGGKLGLLHRLVPGFTAPGRFSKVYALNLGPSFALRAWTVGTKREGPTLYE